MAMEDWGRTVEWEWVTEAMEEDTEGWEGWDMVLLPMEWVLTVPQDKIQTRV